MYWSEGVERGEGEASRSEETRETGDMAVSRAVPSACAARTTREENSQVSATVAVMCLPLALFLM